jgi:ferredoxin-NADP reductase
MFLSAGSGITPLMSMSRAHHDLAEDRDIMFVHNARTPDDIIFARELDLIASNHTNPHVVRRRARRRAHQLAGRHGFPDAAAARS